MKTEKEIRAAMKSITDDERFQYKCATVLENAPLALIQLWMEAQLEAYAFVLREKPPTSRRGAKKK